MNKYEKARFRAFRRLESFMKQINDELMTVELYPNQKIGFDNAMKQLHKAIQKQAKQVKGTTTNKGVLKTNMIDTMFKFTNRACIQALDLQLNNIYFALKKPVTYFSRGKGHDIIGRATAIKNIMSDNLAALPCLSDADIAEMELAIKQYSKIQHRPKFEIGQNKALGTDQIPVWLNKTGEFADNICKLITSYLPHHLGIWNEHAKVGKPLGVRHVSLAIHLTDEVNDLPLIRIKCTVFNGTETIIKYSSKRGWIQFHSFYSASMDIAIEDPYHEPVYLQNISAVEKKTTRINLKLKLIDPEKEIL